MCAFVYDGPRNEFKSYYYHMSERDEKTESPSAGRNKTLKPNGTRLFYCS